MHIGFEKEQREFFDWQHKPPETSMCRGVQLTASEQAYKPSSVFDSHLSRPVVASRLKQPTTGHDGQPLYCPCLVLLLMGFT